MSAIEKYTDKLIQDAYEQGKHDFAARVIDEIEGVKNKCDDVDADNYDYGYKCGLIVAIIIIQRLERESNDS